jgi:hypothetical protein
VLILGDLFKTALTDSANDPGAPIAQPLKLKWIWARILAGASGIYWGYAGQHFAEEMFDEA